ncbi:MAG: ThiF family adenylyltransferase [Desulfohalobiaceae bacterium]|nr:ThiF family adenylyltransferase [Desulfohalobiaceae bacterium]
MEAGLSPCVSRAVCSGLAREFGLSLRDVEIAALEEGVVPRPYIRNIFGLSPPEVLALRRSGICQIGLGGLGGYLLELFTRVGVGAITAADGDVFEESNLNRQLLALEGELGQSKATAAQQRVAQVNSAVDWSGIPADLDEEGLRRAVSGRDLALDALGGLAVRRNLYSAALAEGVPLIIGSVAGEVGYVSTVLPGEEFPQALWSGEHGAESELGCPPHAVSAVASLQAAEAIHFLCGRRPLLHGKLLVLDLSDFSWEVFSLS